MFIIYMNISNIFNNSDIIIYHNDMCFDTFIDTNYCLYKS